MKTQRVVPGEHLFFYRDQNGVEIDFVIERGSNLSLIEAKASERIQKNKLNFSTVVPLLASQYNVKTVIAHPVSDALSLSVGEMTSFNPVLCDFPQ
jgi:uncharacterized protein